MSRQPRSARWATTELPTMPDPITTMRAAAGTSVTGVLLAVGIGRRTVATRSCEHLAQRACRGAYGRRDRVGVTVAGEAVARTVAVDRGDRRAVRVDDRRCDRRDGVIELADRPGVPLAPDPREPTPA